MGPHFSGGNPYPKKKLYQRIHNRLSSQTAFTNVHYQPSKTRPRVVCADVDPALFVEPTYPAAQARLELEFDLRSHWDHYWIQWIEPERGLSCGWHQDQTHMEHGRCHFQIDYPDGTIDRTPATTLEAHPLTVVEYRLNTLPEELTTITI